MTRDILNNATDQENSDQMTGFVNGLLVMLLVVVVCQLENSMLCRGASILNRYLDAHADRLHLPHPHPHRVVACHHDQCLLPFLLHRHHLAVVVA